MPNAYIRMETERRLIAAAASEIANLWWTNPESNGDPRRSFQAVRYPGCNPLDDYRQEGTVNETIASLYIAARPPYEPQPHTPAKASTEAKRQRNTRNRAIARRMARAIKAGRKQ